MPPAQVCVSSHPTTRNAVRRVRDRSAVVIGHFRAFLTVGHPDVATRDTFTAVRLLVHLHFAQLIYPNLYLVACCCFEAKCT